MNGFLYQIEGFHHQRSSSGQYKGCLMNKDKRTTNYFIMTSISHQKIMIRLCKFNQLATITDECTIPLILCILI